MATPPPTIRATSPVRRAEPASVPRRTHSSGRVSHTSTQDRFTLTTQAPAEGENHVLEPRETRRQKLIKRVKDPIGYKQLKQEARIDKGKAPPPLSQGENPLSQVFQAITGEPSRLRLANTPATLEAADHLTTERLPLAVNTLLSEAFWLQADAAEKATALLSHTGVGPGKIFQILASDQSLTPRVREMFSTLKSSGAPTQSLQQAQQMTDRLYGPQKYTLSRLAGVGTVGEVYLATDRDGKTVVIKMLKKGVNETTLRSEWQIATKIIEMGYKDDPKLNYQLHKLNNLYKQWLTELNFQTEGDNAKALAKGATRYKVAQTIETGTLEGMHYPTSMVQEAAEGLSLDEISKMLRVYRESPDRYRQEFSAKLAEHPWLENPNEWMNQIPALYLDSFNEQILLRTKHGKVTASHGDPHAGNVFINYNTTSGKLETTYIDAGLVAMRDSKRAAKHMGLLSNMLFSNTQVMARNMVEMAEVLPDRPKEELIREIKTELDEKLFKARINITNFKHNSELLDKIMDKKGIVMPEQETTFFKSMLQAMMNYKELSALVGQNDNNYLKDSIPDIRRSAFRMLRAEPAEVPKQLMSPLMHFCTEPQQTLRNILQFFVDPAV